MAYVLGTETVTVNVTFAGHRAVFVARGSGDTFDYADDAQVAISVPVGSGAITLLAKGTIPTSYGGDGHWHPTWACGVQATGLWDGTLYDDTVTADITPTFNAVNRWDLDVGGNATVTIECEQCLEVTGPSPTWPVYGGAATVGDAPAQTKHRYFLRAKAGGTISATITSGGASASHTYTIPAGTYEVVKGASFSLPFFPTFKSGRTRTYTTNPAVPTVVTIFNTAGALVLTPTVNGQALVTDWSTQNTGVSVNATGPWECRVGAVPSGSTWTATLTGGALLPRSYALALGVNSDVDAYGGSLDVKVDRWKGGGEATLVAVSGRGSDSYTQRSWGVSGSILGGSGTQTFTGHSVMDEFLPVRAWISPASLSSHGEDARLWRMLQRGHVTTSFSLSQAGSVTVDDGASAANWTAGANTAVSASGGELTFTVSGGTGSATRAFSPAVSLAAYRYLRLRIKDSSGSAPFSLTIGSKVWEGQTSDVADNYINVDFDLCCPGNATATTDTWDSRFPVPTVDGPLWGVTDVTSLTLGGLSDGVTYTVDAITQERASSSVASFLPEFAHLAASETAGEDDEGNWLLLDSRGAANVYGLRGAWGVTDGRQSLEETYIQRTPDMTGAWVYSIRTLADLISDINHTDAGVVRNPGWTATDAAPSDIDGYLTNAQPAVWAYGGGLMYAGGAWVHGLDKDAGAGVSVPMQALCDQVDWYAGCGDIQGLGGTAPAGAIVLAAGAVLRSVSHGLVLLETQQPAPNVEVVATSGGSAAGSDTSDALGWYVTGAPGVPSGAAATTEFQTGVPPLSAYLAVTRTHPGRSRKRSAARVPAPEGDGISADVHPGALRHLRAFVR